MRRAMAWLWLFALAASGAAMAEDRPNVTFAGVAYSGDASSQQQRFPYSKQYESHLKAAGHSAYARALAFVQDRKSTRLNSSHLVISYAVFCLKKKKNRTYRRH